MKTNIQEKSIDFKKMPSEANRIARAISNKLKKSDTKEGVDLVKMAKDLAKRQLDVQTGSKVGVE